jgi:hypothetical protein
MLSSFVLRFWFWCSVSHSFLLLWVLCFWGSLDGVQRFQGNELGLCLVSPELAGLFYASFSLVGLGSSWVCSFVVWLIMIRLSLLSVHGVDLLYVPMFYVWKRWCSFFKSRENVWYFSAVLIMWSAERDLERAAFMNVVAHVINFSQPTIWASLSRFVYLQHLVISCQALCACWENPALWDGTCTCIETELRTFTDASGPYENL